MQIGTFADTAIIGFGAGNVPEGAVANGVVDRDLAEELFTRLESAGLLMAGSNGGRTCLLQHQHWTVTNRTDVLEAWEPCCACDECYTAKWAAIAGLEADPGRFMAFCDMEYTIIR